MRKRKKREEVTKEVLLIPVLLVLNLQTNFFDTYSTFYTLTYKWIVRSVKVYN